MSAQTPLSDKLCKVPTKGKLDASLTAPLANQQAVYSTLFQRVAPLQRLHNGNAHGLFICDVFYADSSSFSAKPFSHVLPDCPDLSNA